MSTKSLSEMGIAPEFDLFLNPSPNSKGVSPATSPVVSIPGMDTGHDFNQNGLATPGGLMSAASTFFGFGDPSTTQADFLGGRLASDLNSADAATYAALGRTDMSSNAQPSGFDNLMGIANTGMSMYNTFDSINYRNDMKDIAKEQLGMAQEQWGMTKAELGRITNARDRINSGYGNGGSYGSAKNDNVTPLKPNGTPISYGG